MIGVLDYGAGNYGSVCRALDALGKTHRRIALPQDFESDQKTDALTHLVFPGVGAAGATMSKLRDTGLDTAIKNYTQQGRMILGICVGMQVLGEFSEEDETPCLNLLPFRLHKMTSALPIPHMGWNNLNWNSQNLQIRNLSHGCNDNCDVYFVHSYAALADESNSFCAASVTYGAQNYLAMVAEHNIWGCQFHVEKSGTVGLQIIKNFLEQQC